MYLCRMWLKVGVQFSIRRRYVFICDNMCALESYYSFTACLPSGVNDTTFLVSIISPTTRHRELEWNFDDNYYFRD